MPSPREIIDVYERTLGRTPSEGEINVHLNHQGNFSQFVERSPEGMQRALNSPRDLIGGQTTTPGPTTTGPAGSGAYGAGGGAWGANYEWTGEGRPNDLLSNVGDTSRLTGFNTAGWGTGERGTESSKNTFGMIASRYDMSDAGITQLLADPDFRRFYPNARRVDVDKIDFGDGKAVDVIRNYDKATGRGDAWAYQPPGGASGARTFAPSPNQTQPVGTPSALPTPTYNPDGTVTVRVSPEVYQRLSTQQYQAPAPTNRQPIRRLVSGGAPPPPEAV